MLLPEEEEQLIQCAVKARRSAYAPYSSFRVGAALLCEDRTIYSGCNIENASYPATICAERVAVGCAVAAGQRRFLAIAVAAGDTPASPCGICRQVLSEFGDMDVIFTDSSGRRKRRSRLSQLLPEAFSLKIEKDREPPV